MSAAPRLRSGVVLVMHGSAVSREILRVSLEKLGGIRVIAAANLELAQSRILKDAPDVVVLPAANADESTQAFREQLEQAGIPVVDAECPQMLDKVKRWTRASRASAAVPAVTESAARPAERPSRGLARLIVLGASTGGTEALRQIIGEMPPDAPPILAVQHMPAGYTRAFARRLGDLSRLDVREAADGDRLVQGRALIAPGGLHARVMRQGGELIVRLEETPQVNGHRPSVDVLFSSVAEVIPPGTAAALLTGMGNDGAEGLLALRAAGAFTVAQDEATSVVFGMPREGIEKGAACAVLPLQRVSRALLRLGE